MTGGRTAVRRAASIEEKIKQAESAVVKAKQKYDACVEELNRLVRKKRELESRELIKAFEKSERTLPEVLEFLGGTGNKGEEEG